MIAKAFVLSLGLPESLSYVDERAFSGDVSMTIRIPCDVEFAPCAFCEPDEYRPFDAEPRVRLMVRRCSKAHA